MKTISIILPILLGVMLALTTHAEVRITEDRPYIYVNHGDQLVRVQRIQDEEHELSGGYARTSRKCPPFCVTPAIPAPGVHGIGELEIFDFLRTRVAIGRGLLVDARTASFFERGTIPGSVNIAFTRFEDDPESEAMRNLLMRLGAKPAQPKATSWWSSLWTRVRSLIETAEASQQGQGIWDFSEAKELALWCNGPWCDQSPRAIRALVDLGYPPEKLHYYRGGMQNWQMLGLTVIIPDISEVGAW
ncbi:rhodanese-like domain-containing protein [Thioalkalivibrio thiocyanodenitrificans]|uniref:rhodanese-like domain-containing protein n=1 Tax=Thioalkalivibrio thiocyanodenitrificans TaxID=243063 RepID=UPI00036213EF|nr:rhodanese-like domain-containing protein [Thioalkalivibrio thiocyanodenitrificans]